MISMDSLKKTALHSVYAKSPGIKLADFGGWEMPIQFSKGILSEHHAVRNSAGLFDVSHMGEIMIRGKKAGDFLNYLLSNRIKGVESGQCIYSVMCNESGGTVDDLLVYVLSSEEYMLVINAANISKDYLWIKSLAQQRSVDDVLIENASNQWSQLALQGPNSLSIMRELTHNDFDPGEINYYQFAVKKLLADCQVLISRTGYTGEDGFEIYCEAKDAEVLWTNLIRKGSEPCGLGARDILRMEAGLPLYGHELSEDISPLEAGLSPFVKMDKGDFCGRAALEEQKSGGIPRRLYGLQMIDSGVAREEYSVYRSQSHEKSIDLGKPLGKITSGGKSPVKDAFIALALLERGCVEQGSLVDVEIRGKRKTAKIVKRPFYRRDT